MNVCVDYDVETADDFCAVSNGRGPLCLICYELDYDVSHIMSGWKKAQKII